jgi:triosephosphate isomerase
MLIAANWKMNLDKKSILEFTKSLQEFKFSNEINTCIFPSITHIDYLHNLIADLPIKIGGQNCHYKSSGAFTGEVSASFLKDTGCEYALIGHSERRIHNNENNDEIKLRAQTAIDSNLKVILCVGENLTNREEGNALEYIEKQINDCLPNNFKNLVIAYEPIWSIGTGKIPSSFEIKEMHSHIKKIVCKISNKSINVLYGGSVNTENINDILKITNVDGVLVGGASLKAKDFLAIYSAAVKHLNNSS